MEYNVAQLLREPMGAQRKYELNEDLSHLEDLEVTEPLTGTVKLTRTKNGVLADLRGHTSVRVPCSRCLDPVDVPVDLSFTEEFHQTVDLFTGAPLRPETDDPALLITDHHELELDDVVRQYLLTSLPIQPLCRGDCLGLCPECGKNLNDGPHSHGQSETDERWSALRSLLDK